MNFLTWLFVGSLCGGLASLPLRRENQSTLLVNLIVGTFGAIVAGIFVTRWFNIETINQRAFSLPSMLISLGGAIVLLIVAYIVRRWRTRTN